GTPRASRGPRPRDGRRPRSGGPRSSSGPTPRAWPRWCHATRRATRPVNSPAVTTRRPASVIRNPDFVKVWAAQTISVFGSQVSGLAIPLVAALVLHVDAFAFALLGTI